MYPVYPGAGVRDGDVIPPGAGVLACLAGDGAGVAPPRAGDGAGYSRTAQARAGRAVQVYDSARARQRRRSRCSSVQAYDFSVVQTPTPVYSHSRSHPIAGVWLR